MARDLKTVLDGAVKSSIGPGLMILLGIGEFGADMKVALVNDGPVTICIDTKNKDFISMYPHQIEKSVTAMLKLA